MCHNHPSIFSILPTASKVTFITKSQTGSFFQVAWRDLGKDHAKSLEQSMELSTLRQADSSDILMAQQVIYFPERNKCLYSLCPAQQL